MRRLDRLGGPQRRFRLLALDHGLTFGTGKEVPAGHLTSLVSECAPYVDGVVVTYGMVSGIAPNSRLNLILQCFGSPEGHGRVKLTSIATALALDAAAVAVQFSLNHPDLAGHIREISHFVDDAHMARMPVLFMTTGYDSSSRPEVAKALRISRELGADLIKTRLPDSSEATAGERGTLSEAVSTSPPVLLAGGSADKNITDKLRDAVSLGFSGYCIGRSIFGAPKPASVAAALSETLTSANEEPHLHA